MKFPQSESVWADPLRTIVVNPTKNFVRILRDDVLGTWSTDEKDIQFESDSVTFFNGDEKWNLKLSTQNGQLCLKGTTGDHLDIFIRSFHSPFVQVLDRFELREVSGVPIHIIITKVYNQDLTEVVKVQYNFRKDRTYADKIEISAKSMVATFSGKKHTLFLDEQVRVERWEFLEKMTKNKLEFARAAPKCRVKSIRS